MISVLVVEDEPRLREAICDLIEGEPGMEVVGRAESAANAIDLAEAKRPDVAVVDVRMPGGGAEAAQGIRKLSPETAVLALSALEDRASVVEMLRARAVGYLVKGTPPVEIIDAIRRAARGQASLPAGVIAEIVPNLLDVTERVQGCDAVSPGKSYVVGLLESAPDVAILADEAGTIVPVNARTEKQFGYAREELIDPSLEMVLRETSSWSGSVAVAASLSPGGGRRDFIGRRKDGTEFPVEIYLSSIETERARIADDIHDDPIQAITAAGMRLQILRRTIDDPEQLSLLREVEQAVDLSISRLRHLVFELRPPALASDGLSAALATYLEEMDDKATTTYRLEDHLTSQPSLEMRTILYRIVREALVNTRKHARAQNVVVALDEREGGYHVRVSDDGIGFVEDSTAPLPGHVGLGAMRDRAALAGGSLTVESAPGSGTTLEIWVPGTAT